MLRNCPCPNAIFHGLPLGPPGCYCDYLASTEFSFVSDAANRDVLQASRKVRPILEQAAAAAAVVTDAEGTAKAQAAAKKAKKLTPDEMKKMRQQADPNYQKKQAAAAGTADEGNTAKNKKGKNQATKAEAAAKPEAASVSTAAAAGTDATSDAVQEDEVAVKHSTAQAASQALHDQATAAGSKRRHGLGFSEDQPAPKKSKPADGQNTAAEKDHPGQAQQAPSASKPSLSADPPPAHKPQQQQRPAAISQPAAASAAAAQGPPVIFTDECTAFVRGLDNKVKEEELRTLLAPCGEIKGVRLVMDKGTGLFKVSPCSWDHTACMLVLCVALCYEATQPQICAHGVCCSTANMHCQILRHSQHTHCPQCIGRIMSMRYHKHNMEC